MSTERKNSLTKADNTRTHSTHKSSNKPAVGAPKKDGAGGKGTWGKEGSEYFGTSPAAADALDPNWDSDEDIAPPKPFPAIQIYKQKVKSVVDEYFVSGDSAEAVQALKELDHENYQQEIVKILLSSSLDKHDRERGLASDLLPRLFPDVLSYDKLVDGFTLLLERIEDLALDIPKADELLAHFLARAVVDDLLPPRFLSPDSADVELAKETLKKAASTVQGRGAAKRVASIWGKGGQQSVKRFKKRVVGLLQEYLVSNDFREADRALRDLDTPSFHYYLVKKAVVLALDSNDADRDKLVSLLSQFSKSGLVSEAHMVAGFKLAAETIKDIALDTPNAPSLLEKLVQRSITTGFLPSSFNETFRQIVASSAAVSIPQK